MCHSCVEFDFICGVVYLFMGGGLFVESFRIVDICGLAGSLIRGRNYNGVKVNLKIS